MRRTRRTAAIEKNAEVGPIAKTTTRNHDVCTRACVCERERERVIENDRIATRTHTHTHTPGERCKPKRQAQRRTQRTKREVERR